MILPPGRFCYTTGDAVSLAGETERLRWTEPRLNENNAGRGPTMNFRNLTEMLRLQAERLGPRPALRWKRYGLYGDLSWEQYRADALACAAALVDAGVRPGDRVGLLSENRVEWLTADMGLLTAGAVNVPPHAPLPARQVQFQLADSGVSWLFVSSREQLDKVASVRAELPALRGLVVFDGAARGEGVV